MFQTIQNGFVAGELSPSLWGRTDLAKYHQGAFTMRNFFVNYRGGAASRAGSAYVGMCKSPWYLDPPRDIQFQFSITQGYALEFGQQYMRIKYQGAYVTEAQKAVTGATQSNPCAVNIPNHDYAVGDWIYINNVGGMTELNGLTWIVRTVPNPNTVFLNDLFGNPLDSSTFPAYTSGGTAARIYTLDTPYATVDLPCLKYTQSADTMTLTCVNTATGTEYPSYELERFGSTNWTLTEDTFASSIAAPFNVVVTAQHTSTGSPEVSTQYSYVVTAVNGKTGEESVASPSGNVTNVDIGIYAGSNTITWAAVAGASSYNVYKATPAYSSPVPIGSLYGYCGTAYGTQFVDTNIVQDFTAVPPTHQNPFAQSPIAEVNMTALGGGYSQSTVGYAIHTTTGTGFTGSPVVVNGGIVAFVIINNGQDYGPNDTITFSGGSGAAANLVIGPSSGTYPGTCAYYQQRRAYAASLNNPDTYWFSQIGAFSNMDSSIPTTDTDAIVGAPWAQQVNGVQFMVPMPGGLVILTGKGAWQLNGGNSAALTPSDQDANPQAYNGCNAILPPITVNYDILYCQEKGSIFRDLSYNFFVNIYTGTDLTVLSNHLFTGYTFTQWAWAEEPYKLVWCVRDDGIMLSLTYLKEQDVYAWSRHDTQGLYVGVCSVTEPPVDAVYTIVARYIGGQWAYYSERFDNRIWSTPEDCWCVDCGLSYQQNEPDAVLFPSAAYGGSNISSVLVIAGGINYTDPVVTASAALGPGGATFQANVTGGVITSVTVLTEGGGYIPGLTVLTVTDPTGVGAVLQAVITGIVPFTASQPVFEFVSAGDVIRVDGGLAVVTEVVTETLLMANITNGLTVTLPNGMPVPAQPGDWSVTTPTSTVSGLNHLEGQTVAIVADGGVQPAQVVTNGTIALQAPATQILVGLPFTPQLQTPYLDPPGQQDASQGKRKNIPAVTVRIEASRGLSVGANQVDASTQANTNAVAWNNLTPIKERNALIGAGNALPLYTGDYFLYIAGGWATTAQVAIEQDFPMPANILAVVSGYVMGDTSG